MIEYNQLESQHRLQQTLGMRIWTHCSLHRGHGKGGVWPGKGRGRPSVFPCFQCLDWVSGEELEKFQRTLPDMVLPRQEWCCAFCKPRKPWMQGRVKLGS